MKTLNYSTIIEQTPDKVFAMMINKDCYPDWAKAWGKGMTFVGEWELGEHLSFMDKERGGTKVLIEEFTLGKVIKCRHVALVNPQNIEIQAMDDVMKKWLGTKEIYYFHRYEDSSTRLEVVMETDETFEGMLANWTIALQFLKDLCESNFSKSA